MRQRTFFDDETAKDDAAKRLARSTDAVSSHEAATEHVASGRNGQQCRLVFDCLTRCDGSTSAELAARFGLDRVMVARRLPDLERQGRVTRCGVRPCTASGRSGIEWRVA